MSILIRLCLVFAIVSLAHSCTLTDQINFFSNKTLLTPYPAYSQNPYDNLTTEQSLIINKTINNKDLVCALKYQDSLKQTYILQTFSSRNEAEDHSFIVTHQGQCGSCSTLLDLIAYLKQNLTAPVRKCGMKGFVNKNWSLNCLKDLGLTDSCSEIWYFNTVNTRKKCFDICMWSWFINEPNVDDKGNLNTCLQCDEDLSGPVFKYYSGRTRRNSGIHSEIDRPSDEIYNITHCYY